LQRDEAVSYLKEVLRHREVVSPDGITLENAQDNHYKVRIKGTIEQQEIIREIAKKHNFSVKQEGNQMVIYKQ
jgi:hypothetical protein